MKKILIAMTFVLCLSSFASFVSATVIDDAITWMYDNGLTIYNNKTDFNATRGLRRDEAAKFYVNFSKLLGKTTYVKTSSQCEFLDINDSWSDLKDIVVESCRLGLFQGFKGKFNPKSQLTNAQAITVLVRLIAGNQNEVGLTHRANNYYTKANELGILGNVSMSSKESIATRGNVGVVIKNGDSYSNGLSTTDKTKPDLVLNSVTINQGISSPKVGDKVIYGGFTIRNLGKAISFSETNKGIFSCTNNGIEIFRYEIKNGYIKENGDFNAVGFSSIQSSNVDLFPAPESNYKLNCSILLSSNNEYPIDDNNYKTITFAVLANDSSNNNNSTPTTNTVVASNFDEINAISSEAFMAGINDFSNSPLGYIVKKNGKYGYVNGQKKLIINTEYDNITIYSIVSNKVLMIVKKSPTNNYDYIMGLMGDNGEILLPLEYASIVPNWASTTPGNYVGFRKTRNGLCGLLDQNGNIIFQANKYTQIAQIISPLSDATINQNTFLIEQDNKWGLINRNGNVIITPQYYNYSILGTKLIAFRGLNKWGLFDLIGNEILPVSYDNISMAYNNQTQQYYITIRQSFDSGSEQKMDLNGNWIN